MLPKWTQNGAQTLSGSSSWEVLKAWYLLYGKHIGGSRRGSRRQLFPDCVSRSSLEGSCGHFFQIWEDFSSQLGPCGGVHQVTFSRFFEPWAFLGPKCLQNPPQEPPGPPQDHPRASFLTNFDRFCYDFLMCFSSLLVAFFLLAPGLRPPEARKGTVAGRPKASG